VGRGHYMVLIHADGIEWRGQRYRSLSVVARKITGARWSGPRFSRTIRCHISNGFALSTGSSRRHLARGLG
jgi:Protein of unknown function (DUF2924)